MTHFLGDATERSAWELRRPRRSTPTIAARRLATIGSPVVAIVLRWRLDQERVDESHDSSVI